MTVAINLAELSPPEVLQSLDFEIVLQSYKAKLLELYPDAADVIELESEPLVKLMQLAAWREMLLIARYNDEARSLLLAYATGANLDHIAFTYYRRETRLVITPADPDAIPPVEEVLESDTDFRNRVALKLESYSTAGPTEAFIYHALTASGQVKDASCTSPQPGTSLVTVLSREGNGTPSEPVLAAVEARLNDGEVRPLSEEVLVQAAEIIEYELIVSIYTYAGPDYSIVLADAEAELIKYQERHHRLGHDHTISGLHAAAQRPGVQKVLLSIADDIVVNEFQAAWCTSLTVLHAGIAV